MVLLNATQALEDKLLKQTVQDNFFPVVDGSFVPESPSTLVRSGRFYKNISVIIGWTYNDGSVSASPLTATTEDAINYIKANFPRHEYDYYFCHFGIVSYC